MSQNVTSTWAARARGAPSACSMHKQAQALHGCTGRRLSSYSLTCQPRQSPTVKRAEHWTRVRQGKQSAPVGSIRQRSEHSNPMPCGVRVPGIGNTSARVQLSCQKGSVLKLSNSRRASGGQRRCADVPPSSIRRPITSLKQGCTPFDPSSAPRGPPAPLDLSRT